MDSLLHKAHESMQHAARRSQVIRCRWTRAVDRFRLSLDFYPVAGLNTNTRNSKQHAGRHIPIQSPREVVGHMNYRLANYAFGLSAASSNWWSRREEPMRVIIYVNSLLLWGFINLFSYTRRYCTEYLQADTYRSSWCTTRLNTSLSWRNFLNVRGSLSRVNRWILTWEIHLYLKVLVWLLIHSFE